MNKKIKVCIDCEDEFTEKKIKAGKTNQCDHCSKSDTTNRVIGYNDGSLNKAQHISVYTGTSKEVKKRLTGFRMV